MGLQLVEPAQGTCPASCGHTDSNHHGGTRTHDPKSTTTTVCRALVDNHSLALDARLEMSELKMSSPTRNVSHTITGCSAKHHDLLLANAPATSTRLSNVGPDNHSFSSGGRGFFSWPLASSLVGPIARFPGRPPLDRPTVGGATPTLLGGVLIGSVCGSAHLLTFCHVRNGDGAEWEMGWVRRPLLADWLKRDAMPVLDSAHVRACWRAHEECRK